MKYKKPLIVAAGITTLIGGSVLAVSPFIPTHEQRQAVSNIEPVESEEVVPEPIETPAESEAVTNPAPLPSSQPVVPEAPAPAPVVEAMTSDQIYVYLMNQASAKEFKAMPNGIMMTSLVGQLNTYIDNKGLKPSTADLDKMVSDAVNGINSFDDGMSARLWLYQTYPR